jgi:hypothetical protein
MGCRTLEQVIITDGFSTRPALACLCKTSCPVLLPIRLIREIRVWLFLVFVLRDTEPVLRSLTLGAASG